MSLQAGKYLQGERKCTGDAAITCGVAINGWGVEEGNLVWLIRRRDHPTITIFPLKAVTFAEARQSLTSSSEGHCPCPSHKWVKPPCPPKRAGVCRALVSNWDEVLVFKQAMHREGDQGWLPAPA